MDMDESRHSEAYRPQKPLRTAAFCVWKPYSIVWVCWVCPVFNSHFNTPLEIRKWALDFVNFL